MKMNAHIKQLETMTIGEIKRLTEDMKNERSSTSL